MADETPSDGRQNRRAEDGRIDSIHLAVSENTKGIADINNRIEPMERVWNDVAAVGRFGALIKSVIAWVTVVGASMAAIYHYLIDVKAD